MYYVIETPRLDDRAAGAALLVGYAVVLAILYRDPAAGIRQTTRGIPALVYFFLLPVGGMVIGGYALFGGSYGGVLVFVAGSYLGVLGVALALGGVVSAPIALAGVGVFLLSVVAVVTSVRSLVASLGFDLDM